MGYKLYTDVNCDLPLSYTKAHDVAVLPVSLILDGKEYSLTNDPEEKDHLDYHWFYDKLRAGVPSKTAQTNIEAYYDAFEIDMKAGVDVIYLAFSSGLSGSYNSSIIARQMLLEKYPERDIRIVDTLAASLGQGLLVDLVVKKRDEGASLDELEEYANKMRRYVHHWFTVDDLNHLKRGGRVSGASAFIGTMLSIKPVLNVDQEGHLIPKEKQQGRKRALKGLVDHMQASCSDPLKYPVFISHGDCEADAMIVAKMLKERMGVDVTLVDMIAPIIGTHSGPGTVALFYVGDKWIDE